MTFTFENNVYTSNDTNTHFYREADGRKTRIKKSEFDLAFDNFTEEARRRLEEDSYEAGHLVEQEPKQKKAAPKKRTRRSKDIAFEYEFPNKTLTLTAKQVDFIKHLPDTVYWQEGLYSEIWVDCLCDEIQGQFAGKPMTVGAMVSTLCEKGLATRAIGRINGVKATSFCLTVEGQIVAEKLGI